MSFATTPHFGQRVKGVVYKDRPGAYAVIRDEAGRIAVVLTGKAYFLPGGGCDNSESCEQTLAREGLEECGRSILVVRELGKAVQYVSTRSGKHYAKQCAYFEGKFDNAPVRKPSEPDNVLHFLSPAEAMSQLVLEADRWALSRLLESTD
ncbi:MAG TPA: NUDIX domain-containing protein [Tepidisphaeraceae bacterium]|nr:NUDIX domain-containing protein [Tepidisphaeraceae bacterium]